MVKLFSKNGREFYLFLFRLLGYFPTKLSVFQQAFVHRSLLIDCNKVGGIQHNERLEYLGDAVLGALVAELLYLKYPDYNEGELTRIRASLVSRKSLNSLAFELGFVERILYNATYNDLPKTHIPGNVVEAFVAAVYLDGGLKRARKFVSRYVVTEDKIKSVCSSVDNANYKSAIYEWCQKKHYEIHFNTYCIDERENCFVSQLFVNGVLVSEANGYQKKKAEQEAARLALEKCESSEIEQIIPNVSSDTAS